MAVFLTMPQPCVRAGRSGEGEAHGRATAAGDRGRTSKRCPRATGWGAFGQTSLRSSDPLHTITRRRGRSPRRESGHPRFSTSFREYWLDMCCSSTCLSRSRSRCLLGTRSLDLLCMLAPATVPGRDGAKHREMKLPSCAPVRPGRSKAHESFDFSAPFGLLCLPVTSRTRSQSAWSAASAQASFRRMGMANPVP